MITGLNQNAAGQYALAVESLLDALKAGTLDITAQFIGRQLDAIKRDHPSEYDQGVQSYLEPPVRQYPYVPGMSPAQLNAYLRGRQSRPNLPPSRLTPALSFPGSTPAPTPAGATNAPAAAH